MVRGIRDLEGSGKGASRGVFISASIMKGIVSVRINKTMAQKKIKMQLQSIA